MFWDAISLFGHNGTETPKLLKVVQNDIVVCNLDLVSSIVTKIVTDKRLDPKNKPIMAFFEISQN